jgi:hypothetical protein
MKKILPLFLIALALSHIAGVMPVYFYMLEGIKSDISLQMKDESRLEKLLINQNDYNNPAVFQKTEEGEFIFKGQHYDFTKSESTDEGFVFWVVKDNKETVLSDFLISTFDKSDKSRSTKTPYSGLLKNFDKDYIGNSVEIFENFVSSSSISLQAHTCNILAGYHEAFVVPPDFSGAVA